MSPSSGSTSTTTRCVPKGNVKFSGSKKLVALSPGSSPGGRPSTSAYAYNVHIMMEKLLRHQPFAQVAQREGLKLYIESGNRNNENVRTEFEKLCRVNGFEIKGEAIRSIKKNSKIAVQLADYLAFFSWRLAEKAAENNLWNRCCFLDIATRNVDTVGCLAERFTPNFSYPK